MVTFTIGGQSVKFLVDTEATHLVLLEPLTNQTMEVQGATGAVKEYKWTTAQTVNLGQGTATPSFIVILKCSYPLLEWDLLNKL